MKKIILLKNDIYTESLFVYLESQFSNTEVHSFNQKHIFDVLEREKYDCLILDTHLKNSKGLLLAEKIIKTFPNQKILFLTTTYVASRISQQNKYNNCLFIVIKEHSLSDLEETIINFLAGNLTQAQFSFENSVLTEKELEILFLLSSGLTHKNIATTLKISPKTVRNHLYKIRHKLGVESSVEAVVSGIRKGLV